jgi:hypothetical protein
LCQVNPFPLIIYFPEFYVIFHSSHLSLSIIANFPLFCLDYSKKYFLYLNFLWMLYWNNPVTNDTLVFSRFSRLFVCHYSILVSFLIVTRKRNIHHVLTFWFHMLFSVSVDEWNDKKFIVSTLRKSCWMICTIITKCFIFVYWLLSKR